MTWQPIETAPKERVGPAIYEDHGPTILVSDGIRNCAVAQWCWHKNMKTGNWKYPGKGIVVWFSPKLWMPVPQTTESP